MSTKRDKMNDTIRALIYTGMEKYTASILAFLISEKDWVTSKDIVKATNLHQPVVSITIRDLENRGWVERDRSKKRYRGRPLNIYRMSVDIDEVYSLIENDEKSKIHGVEDNLKDLREMWSLG